MKPKTIDEYIALQPVTHHEILEKMRAIIRSAAPKAEETISYMIACFKYKGLLVGFGATKKGCSFYVMSGTLLNDHKKELKDFSGTKSAIHFDLDKKLPVALIKKLTKERLKQNIAKSNKTKKHDNQ
jgi:uncharacterized protein YdhG (YjbR/CyaY superfamily)